VWETVVEAIAAGTGTSVSIAVLARRWFRHAVQDVVNESIADVIKRQSEFETRQGKHLDKQDRKLDQIQQRLDRLKL
jgi:hypothetical protein